MFAETVHTIFLSLPDSEQRRFLSMVSKSEQRPKPKAKSNDKYSKERCLDIAAALMKKKRAATTATLNHLTTPCEV
jgi:hypothetical protein